eukprot:COSAG03_NODE_735_length_6040_cov_59.467598_9_plen_46_part_00
MSWVTLAVPPVRLRGAPGSILAEWALTASGLCTSDAAARHSERRL